MTVTFVRILIVRHVSKKTQQEEIFIDISIVAQFRIFWILVWIQVYDKKRHDFEPRAKHVVLFSALGYRNDQLCLKETFGKHCKIVNVQYVIIHVWKAPRNIIYCYGILEYNKLEILTMERINFFHVIWSWLCWYVKSKCVLFILIDLFNNCWVS